MVALDGIQEFVAVVEGGSFTGAATRLGLAKSVVSERITGLENRLGIRLLHRSTRSLTVTEAGRVYFESCVRLLATAVQGEEAVQELGRGPRGRLRITCTADFAADHIVPILGDFCARYPGVVPELILKDEFSDLLVEKIDLAVRFGPLTSPNMIVRRLGRLRGFVVAAPAYVERRGPLSGPDDLTAHDCLMFTPYPWGGEWRLINRHTGERRRVKVRERAWIGTGLVLRDSTLAGAGISLLATPLCGAFLRDGRLVDMLPGWEADVHEGATVERVVCVVYPDNKWIPPKVRAFVDFLVAHVGDPPYWDRGL